MKPYYSEYALVYSVKKNKHRKGWNAIFKFVFQDKVKNLSLMMNIYSAGHILLKKKYMTVTKKIHLI